MRCLNCEYPLWDIEPGPCPECGEVFDPTGQDFRVGAVRFCCPHCDQGYYGDGVGGHLDPPTFDCVQCERRISESECIVRPAAGGSREDTVRPGLVPWFDSKVGFFKRLMRTIGWSLSQPGRLGREAPAGLGMMSGLGFAMVAQSIVAVVTAVSIGVVAALFIFSTLPAAGGPAAPAQTAGILALTIVAWSVGGLVVSLIGYLVFGAIVHGLLRITGPTKGGMSRTISFCGFASGPVIMMAIPVLGIYCFGYIAGIWMIVSLILMLRSGQEVSGGRATFAVLGPFFAIVGLYVIFIVTLLFGTAGAGPGPGGLAPVPVPVATAGVGGPDQVVDGLMDVASEVGGLPDPAVAAARFPADLSGPVVRFNEAGMDGWYQPGCLVADLGGGTMIVAALNLDDSTVLVRQRTDKVLSMSMSTASGPARDPQEVLGSLQEACVDAGHPKETFTLELVEAWFGETRDRAASAGPATGESSVETPESEPVPAGEG